MRKVISNRLEEKPKKFRSRLEANFSKLFPTLPYEKTKLPYTVTHTYTPDFKLAENVYIETKGIFSGADRNKHLYIRTQHPEVRIIFVFYDSTKTLSKSSSTTYGQWCTKNGFAWIDIKDIAVHTYETLSNLSFTKGDLRA